MTITEMSDSLLNSPHTLPLLHELVDELIDSCIMDGILVMHRAIKLGYFHVIAPDPTPDEEIGDAASLIRSGNNTANNGRDNSAKAASCCRCVKCHSKVAATRYAPHLSNCMGLGRNSSRRANKRIADLQRLEDNDEDCEDVYTQDSCSASQHAPSDASSSRLTGSTVNKQHSPLKLTISLVSTSNKSNSTKHVIRTVNGAPVSDCKRPHTDNGKSSKPVSSAIRTCSLPKAQLASLKPSSSEITLKEAKIALTSHDINYTLPRN